LQNLQEALVALCDQVAAAVSAGTVLVVLTDNQLEPGLLPIHALLATGAVHQRLTRDGLRCDANLLIETGTCRDSHSAAALIGYGATAIFPYLSYHVINGLIESGEVLADVDAAYKNYRKALDKGLMKILSKMGISTVASYRGAQLFEAIGLSDEVTGLCFDDTPSRVQGARFEDLEKDQKALATIAWLERKSIDQGGLLSTCMARNITPLIPMWYRPCKRRYRAVTTLLGTCTPSWLTLVQSPLCVTC
jgi:glutamate synthase (NADPH/NADH) large chain